MELRIRETGAVITEHAFRELFDNISFPQPLPADILDEYGADEVVYVAPPAITLTQTVDRQGAEQVNGQWQARWVVTEHPADVVADMLAQSKSQMLLQIDAEVDSIYAAVMGNRASEYTLAESDAIDYKGNSYAGTVPASVQAWASAKGQTARWAADDILATATQWRAAQATIRTARLGYKEAVRASATLEALETVRTGWIGFVRTARAQLGLPSPGL